MSNPLIAFYLGQSGAGQPGRTLDEIWRWDPERLERVHDYIQWLFPLAERSRFNPAAPVLDPETIRRFRGSDLLKGKLKHSLEVMLRFYGLELQERAGEAARVVRAGTFDERSRTWLTFGNHNHLRLTRILTSTRLLGLEPCSGALFDCLAEIYRERPGEIGQTTYEFWRRAAVGN